MDKTPSRQREKTDNRNCLLHSLQSFLRQFSEKNLERFAANRNGWCIRDYLLVRGATNGNYLVDNPESMDRDESVGPHLRNFLRISKDFGSRGSYGGFYILHR